MNLIKRLRNWLNKRSVESIFERGYKLGKKHALKSIAFDYKYKKEKFEYTSRADMAMDIRDIGQIVEKLNEVIKSINQRAKLAKVIN